MLSNGVFKFLLVVLLANACCVLGELKQVHVVFRHANRTTDKNTLYPNDPYLNETFYPYGLGELTNAGRQRAYDLGKSLRARYNDTLGELYLPEVLSATTTDTSRTKMTLDLVDAALFVPQGTLLDWNPAVYWQPIPYSYVPMNQDRVLTVSFGYCTNYMNLYQNYLASPAGLRSQDPYQQLFENLTVYTGKPFKTTFDAYLLYFALSVEEELGLELPSWTEDVSVETLKEMAMEQYVIMSATTEMKQLSGGFFLKKIVNDMLQKIQGTLTPSGRKMFLYSGHEINIAYILNAAEVYFKHIPPYTANIMFELHEINEVWGVQIFYQDYTATDPKLLTVPGCEQFCPLTQFIGLLQKNFPANNTVCG